MAAISAKAKHASSVMNPPASQMPRKNHGLCTAEAIGAAVRKMPEPMMPPTSSITESISERPRTSEGSWCLPALAAMLRDAP